MTQDRDGRRKDGKPYKAGNTRDDGSYEVGRGRTPVGPRFAVGDGRTRGRRPKGTKNFATDWEEVLNAKTVIKVNGVPTEMSNHRALVLATVNRGQAKSDRAAETAFRNAPAQRETASLALSDAEIVAIWQAQQAAQQTGDPETTSDEPADDL